VLAKTRTMVSNQSSLSNGNLHTLLSLIRLLDSTLARTYVNSDSGTCTVRLVASAPRAVSEIIKCTICYLPSGVSQRCSGLDATFVSGTSTESASRAWDGLNAACTVPSRSYFQASADLHERDGAAGGRSSPGTNVVAESPQGDKDWA